MLRRYFLLFTFCFFTVATFAQTSPKNNAGKPKLVVGLVIDQMRWDYLYHFQQRYGTTGFKRLLKEGFSCENTMIPYLPTYTAPGHSCIYTGSVPAINGIIGNNWWVREKNDSTYCTDDKTVFPVGGSWKSGQMSPRNMLTTTVGDELRLSNNLKSKVFGISLKDRGGILPAGHRANAAYWYDDSTGNWMTSSFYMNNLPKYVDDFNAKKLSDKYLKQNWNTMYPIASYTLSTADDKGYEMKAATEERPVFPHMTEKALIKNNYKELRYSPYGNTMSFDFAKTMIDAEQMGSRGVTDFFAISLSSTDYIGHRFGPNSIELEDTYLRLDKELGEFLNYLDSKIGKGQYLFFLSSDHGVGHATDFLAENKIPGAMFPKKEFEKSLIQQVDSLFNIKKAVKYFNNYQLYLDNDAIKASGKEKEVYEFILNYCKAPESVQDAFYIKDMYKSNIPEPVASMMKNGYNAKRSGDIQMYLKPGYFEVWDHAATHGLWVSYDRHIPLLFYGWSIKPGKLYREVYMTDIAPTISAMLQIQMPNGSVGKVITELVK
jgi:predicted AlkP superfamily pyrophosphatase or phosphodiesterase